MEAECSSPIDFSQHSVKETGHAGESIEMSVNFEIVNGYKIGTKYLYSTDEKMFYTKRHQLKHYVLYRCKMLTCRSKLWIKAGNVCVKANEFVEHNHPDMEEEYSSLVMRNKIITATTNIDTMTSTSGSSDIHTIYRRIVFE